MFVGLLQLLEEQDSQGYSVVEALGGRALSSPHFPTELLIWGYLVAAFRLHIVFVRSSSAIDLPVVGNQQCLTPCFLWWCIFC